MRFFPQVFSRFPALGALVVAAALAAASAWGQLSINAMWLDTFGSSSPFPVLWGARVYPPLYLGTFLFIFFVILIAFRIPLRAAFAELASLAMGFVCGAMVTVAVTLLVSAKAFAWSWLVLLGGMVAGVFSGFSLLKEAAGFSFFGMVVVLALAFIVAGLAVLAVVAKVAF